MNIQYLGLCFPVLLSWSFPKHLTGGHGQEDPAQLVVQLLLPSLLPQLPSPAQTGLRLLRFSVSTYLKLLVRKKHRTASGGKDPCWTGNQSTATTLNTPLGMSKVFFPRCSPANLVSESSSKGEKFQIFIGHSFQFCRGGQPATAHPPPLTFSLASDTKGLSMLRHESICSCSSRE